MLLTAVPAVRVRYKVTEKVIFLEGILPCQLRQQEAGVVKSTSNRTVCVMYINVFVSNVWLNWVIWLDLDESIRTYIYIHMENCASTKGKAARNLFIYFFF